jgi:hypothetical protein
MTSLANFVWDRSTIPSALAIKVNLLEVRGKLDMTRKTTLRGTNGTNDLAGTGIVASLLEQVGVMYPCVEIMLFTEVMLQVLQTSEQVS